MWRKLCVCVCVCGCGWVWAWAWVWVGRCVWVCVCGGGEWVGACVHLLCVLCLLRVVHVVCGVCLAVILCDFYLTLCQNQWTNIVVASHAAGPGLIHGQVSYLVELFSGIFSQL